MKVIEQDRLYFICVNGVPWKKLWNTERSAVNYSHNLAMDYDGFKDGNGNFKEQVIDVRFFDALKCLKVYSAKNTKEKRRIK